MNTCDNCGKNDELVMVVTQPLVISRFITETEKHGFEKVRQKYKEKIKYFCQKCADRQKTE